MEDFSSDQVLTIFVGALLAILVAVVLTGGADKLRRGVRQVFASDDESEEYTPATLQDYADGAFSV